MKMSNLPKDLIEEIISRVPLKYMRAVRLTCKTWNALFKSRSFTTMHIDKQEATAKELGESPIIVMMDYNLFLMNNIVNENPSTKAKYKLTCLNDSEQVKISQVFHCDGLLLCILKDESSLVVWNPYSGKTRWIEFRHTYHTRVSYKYGIGYKTKKNKSCRSYKILRFRDGYDRYTNIGDRLLWYEIYDFDSNLWTTHNMTTSWNIEFCGCGVSLNGNTYWCATKGNRQINYTVCFDFTRKRFRGLQYLPLIVQYEQFVTLSCFRDEKLALLAHSMLTSVIEIWITNKIEEQKVSWSNSLPLGSVDKATKVSWNKFLRVDMRLFTAFRISDGCFFFDEEKKVAVVFNKVGEERLDTVKIFGEKGYLKELNLGEPLDKKCWPLVCSYVPSIVQIKQPKGGKRKNQSE